MTKRHQKPPTDKARSPQKPIPTFATEEAERDFWDSADSADFVDWRTAIRVRLPELKPSTATISLRLPEGMLEELKMLANERDVPYQSLLKVFLAERIRHERGRRRSA
jgi:predicted DNA binding CopG/RHH family protein